MCLLIPPYDHVPRFEETRVRPYTGKPVPNLCSLRCSSGIDDETSAPFLARFHPTIRNSNMYILRCTCTGLLGWDLARCHPWHSGACNPHQPKAAGMRPMACGLYGPPPAPCRGGGLGSDGFWKTVYRNSNNPSRPSKARSDKIRARRTRTAED